MDNLPTIESRFREDKAILINAIDDYYDKYLYCDNGKNNSAVMDDLRIQSIVKTITLKIRKDIY